MSPHPSSDPNLSRLINLLKVEGLLIIIAAGIILYPAIQNVLLPAPAAFGDQQLPLRPTVTSLPADGAAPVVLPETPLLAPNQALPIKPPAAPPGTDPVDSLPVRIVIPAIHLDAPIETVGWSQVDGVDVWDVPNHFAAGWLKSSAPLGQVGNTVLDGHHNIVGEVFRNLIDLSAGDLIEVYSRDRVFKYQVSALLLLPDRDQPIEVQRQNAQWIQPTLDDRLTLVTCWPYTSNTHRVIIVAKPIASN